MIKSLFYSITFHSVMILLTVLSLPFMLREPIELPPIVSVELIQISDKTNIPYAPKARKIIEETKKKEERVVSEQAPPAAKAKEKPDRIPLPNEKKEEKKIEKKKQNPEEVKPEIRQSSEFEKKEIIDTNQIAALIDKAKEITDDLHHCKLVADQNSTFWGGIAFWIESPTADTQHESIYRKCLINRGHSVLN